MPESKYSICGSPSGLILDLQLYVNQTITVYVIVTITKFQGKGALRCNRKQALRGYSLAPTFKIIRYDLVNIDYEN